MQDLHHFLDEPGKSLHEDLFFSINGVSCIYWIPVKVRPKWMKFFKSIQTQYTQIFLRKILNGFYIRWFAKPFSVVFWFLSIIQRKISYPRSKCRKKLKMIKRSELAMASSHKGNKVLPLPLCTRYLIRQIRKISAKWQVFLPAYSTVYRSDRGQCIYIPFDWFYFGFIQDFQS